MPKVSVIIPVYNGEQYVGDAIRCALAQTIEDIEVIVVDDGSTDGTASLVRGIAKTENRLQYFYKPNGGQASARNLGAGYATGQFLAFLDADDCWVENKLEKQLILFGNSDVAVVYSDAVVRTASGEYRQSGVTRLYEGNIYKKLLYKNFIVNSTVIIRKKVFDKYLFNEKENFRSVEDYDLWLRISKDNHKFTFSSDALATYTYVQRLAGPKDLRKSYVRIINLYLSLRDYSSANTVIIMARLLYYVMAYLLAGLKFKIKHYARRHLSAI